MVLTKEFQNVIKAGFLRSSLICIKFANIEKISENIILNNVTLILLK